MDTSSLVNKWPVFPSHWILEPRVKWDVAICLKCSSGSQTRVTISRAEVSPGQDDGWDHPLQRIYHQHWILLLIQTELALVTEVMSQGTESAAEAISGPNLKLGLSKMSLVSGQMLLCSTLLGINSSWSCKFAERTVADSNFRHLLPEADCQHARVHILGLI